MVSNAGVLTNKSITERRVGTADDVARIVAWLCGDDAKWVSSKTIWASGSYLMLQRRICRCFSSKALRLTWKFEVDLGHGVWVPRLDVFGRE